MDKPVNFAKESAHRISTGQVVKVIKGPRQEFDTDGIRKFVNDRSIKVTWEKSYLCPCRSKRTQVADMACPVCHGTGIAYLAPVKEQLMIQSQDKSVSNGDLGLFDSGTAIGTTFTESNMSFRDRITIPEVTISQSLIFDVTDDRVEHGMYLSYKVDKLELVVAQNRGVITEGIDYTFSRKDNRFFPKKHLLGLNISINMQTVLRYLIIDLLKESRYQYTEKNNQKAKFENLPRKLLLKREDVFVQPEQFSLTSDIEPKLDDREGTPVVDPKRKPKGSGYFPGDIDD